ncbi:MAG: M20/M25/M40 family metallo-hydrolase [Thermoanaerobaculia bacterium]
MRRFSRLLLAAAAVGALGQTTPSEPLRWLAGYVRIDTSNPPGHEHRAAAYLAAILQGEGIPTRLYESPEGRVSLVARLPRRSRTTLPPGYEIRHAETEVPGPGDADAPPGLDTRGGALVLLHHMDTVPAAHAQWMLDPWAATLADGALWGRGALDAKSLGVAHLAAFLELHRSRAPLVRDVVLMATADEESGGTQGLAWLLESQPELAEQTAAVLTEGGANRARGGKPLWWGIEVTQKRPLWLEARTRGRGGHAAAFDHYSATALLVRALDRVVEREPRLRVTPAAKSYLAALAPMHGEPMRSVWADVEAAARNDRLEDHLPRGMAGLFLDSVQVTMLEAGTRVNVTPPEALARLDARLLPDTDSRAFLGELRATLGPDVELEVLLDAPAAPASPTGHWAYACVRDVLDDSAPVVPAFIAGVTDARHFRARGVPAYGVSPFALGGADMLSVHAADERIAVAAFEQGVDRMVEIVRRCATG